MSDTVSQLNWEQLMKADDDPEIRPPVRVYNVIAKPGHPAVIQIYACQERANTWLAIQALTPDSRAVFLKKCKAGVFTDGRAAVQYAANHNVRAAEELKSRMAQMEQDNARYAEWARTGGQGKNGQ
ncbi:MAG: hypothetical protein L0332_34490 [Chloroflexi bacterium]|nr:hypothetical protein [Chloroflexota bacterium]